MSEEAEKEIRKTYGNDAAKDFLQEMKGGPVVIRLHGGIEYHGNLSAIDEFLNTTLRDTKEIYDGTVVSNLGEIFLRGSSVVYIALA